MHTTLVITQRKDSGYTKNNAKGKRSNLKKLEGVGDLAQSVMFLSYKCEELSTIPYTCVNTGYACNPKGRKVETESLELAH